MRKWNQFYGEMKLFCLVRCESWNPYELKVWCHFRGMPWWSENCHRHRSTQKQILHDYYLHDLIQCRFLLFLFGLTRTMSCFFSFNCPLHHLQCILSKDTAGKVRCVFSRQILLVFSSTKMHLKNWLCKKASWSAWLQLSQSLSRPCTSHPLELISLGCKLRVHWGSLLAFSFQWMETTQWPAQHCTSKELIKDLSSMKTKAGLQIRFSNLKGQTLEKSAGQRNSQTCQMGENTWESVGKSSTPSKQMPPSQPYSKYANRLRIVENKEQSAQKVIPQGWGNI